MARSLLPICEGGRSKPDIGLALHGEQTRLGRTAPAPHVCHATLKVQTDGDQHVAAVIIPECSGRWRCFGIGCQWLRDGLNAIFLKCLVHGGQSGAADHRLFARFRLEFGPDD